MITLLVKARRTNRTDHIEDRIGEFFLIVLGQGGVLRDPIPGIAHFFTFWGFIIIQFGLLNLMLRGLGTSLPLIGDSHVFAGLLDAFIIFVAVALVFFAIRRGIVRPKQLSSALHGPLDGFIILIGIMLILVTLALVEIFDYAASGGASWSLFGTWFGPAFSGAGTNTNLILFRVFWWIHVTIFFAFLVYIPRSKHLHLMATPFNVFFRNYGPKGALPLMENLEEREDYGVSKPEQFTWKQLLDGYACTECGRCNTVCPASNTGKPLFPKEIILGVKEALFVQSDRILGEDNLWSKLGVAGVRSRRDGPGESRAPRADGGRHHLQRGAVVLHQLPRLHGDLPRLHRACANDRRYAPPSGDGGERLSAGSHFALQQHRAQRQSLGDQQRQTR